MPESVTLDPKQRDQLRTEGLDSLYFFVKGILGFDWLIPHIHMELCSILQNPKNTHVLVTLPRGWLKSTICSIGYPLWLATRDPNIRILITQNSFTNACKKLAGIRALVEGNSLYRLLYPEVLPSKESTWKSDALELTRTRPNPEATFEAAGTGTSVISRHYDVVIEDDTIAPDLDELREEAPIPSQEDVEKAIGWHKLVGPLLLPGGTSKNIVVGTRWFEKDTISWVSDNEPHFVRYERAAVENEEGESDPTGKPAWPEMFDSEVLTRFRSALGPYMFSCLYMNRPVRPDDMVFKPEWIQYYHDFPNYHKMMFYTTIDLAPPDSDRKGDPDYNVVCTCGKDLESGRIFIAKYTRKRCSPSEVIDDLFYQVREFRPVKVGIESVSYQAAFQYWVRERMRQDNLRFMVEGIKNSKTSKEVRIRGLQPILANGDMAIRGHQKELMNEILSFPYGAHDDIIDCISMQIPMWALTRTEQKPIPEELEGHEFNFQMAVEEIRNRNKEKTLIFDVFHREPSLF